MRHLLPRLHRQLQAPELHHCLHSKSITTLNPSAVSLSIALHSRRTFSTTPSVFRPGAPTNQILTSVRNPPTFHTYLQSSSSNNALLLLLFTSSASTPSRTITPLLTSIIQSRPTNNPLDRYTGGISFAEVELDSPDTSNGTMTDLGVEFGVNSIPTLMGFGGRRAERVTERITDTDMLSDRGRMERWIDEQMQKGDPYGTEGQGKSLWQRLFG